MKKILLLAALFLAAYQGYSQKKTGIRFTNITSMGILYGESEKKFTIQTVNGIKYKQWSLGLGTGFDDYGFSSIPVFIDVRKQFGNKNWKPLLYADGGLNFEQSTNTLPDKWQDGTDAYKKFHPFYGEFGVGFSRAINKKVSLQFTAGYSYKKYSYEQAYYPMWWSYVGPSDANPKVRYDYYYKRLSVKVGLVF